MDNLPLLPFPGPVQFEDWLRANHASVDGIWIKMAKKASGIPSITHDAALDVALCYGWIDSLRRGSDEMYFVQKFTPRRPGSAWSARNIARVKELIEVGKMRPAGSAEIEAAQRDGRIKAG